MQKSLVYDRYQLDKTRFHFLLCTVHPTITHYHHFLSVPAPDTLPLYCRSVHYYLSDSTMCGRAAYYHAKDLSLHNIPVQTLHPAKKLFPDLPSFHAPVHIFASSTAAFSPPVLPHTSLRLSPHFSLLHDGFLREVRFLSAPHSTDTLMMQLLLLYSKFPHILSVYRMHLLHLFLMSRFFPHPSAHPPDTDIPHTLLLPGYNMDYALLFPDFRILSAI